MRAVELRADERSRRLRVLPEEAEEVGAGNGAVIADPFQRSADAVRLLMLRRYQLLRQGGDVAPARSLLRRLVPGPRAAPSGETPAH